MEQIKDNNQNMFFLETKGYSMYPFLKSGSKVLVKRVGLDDLKVGDIVVYKTNGQTICHRVIGKCIEGIEVIVYARGDAASGVGEKVAQDMFLGKVIGITKNEQVIRVTGKYRDFINLLIVKLGPFINRLIRIIKIPLRPVYHYIRNLNFRRSGLR